MASRKIWEEPLFSSNAPLPTRPMTDDHPLGQLHRSNRGLRQYIDGDDALHPWIYQALAPQDLERSWLPLAEHTETVWLARNQTLRLGLIDYSTGQVLAWRLRAGSEAYAPRKPRRMPDDA